jgi:hypothetical protein
MKSSVLKAPGVKRIEPYDEPLSNFVCNSRPYNQRDFMRAAPLAEAAKMGHVAAAQELLKGRAGVECLDAAGEARFRV